MDIISNDSSDVFVVIKINDIINISLRERIMQ